MSTKTKQSDEKLELTEKENSITLVLNNNENHPESKNNNIEESFEMVKDLQDILQNCSELTNDQKSDYCQSQRYFMKQYLINLNKKNF
ncbi:MAG: hypothetical protein KGD57_00900 [Candidatus Lokiarchaeota archaeon]|nr:hypothetical protein [Candidatus Lokiarchaeota archaeon]